MTQPLPVELDEEPKRRRVSSKRALFTGFAALLPLALTVFLIVWAWGFINKYISQPVNKAIKTSLVAGAKTHRGRTFMKYWFEVSDEALNDRSKGRQLLRDELESKFSPIVGLSVGFLAGMAFLYVFGWLLATYLGRKAFRVTERLVSRMPGLKSIYPYAKRVTSFFLGPKDEAKRFSRVVAIQYPRKGLWSIAFVTGDGLPDINKHTGKPMLNVLVPTSPAPMTGFVIFVPADEVIPLRHSVEDTMTFLVSAGVLAPGKPMQDGGLLPSTDSELLRAITDGMDPSEGGKV